MTDDATGMKRLGHRPPTSSEEPDELVLVEHVSDGRVALITLNRPIIAAVGGPVLLLRREQDPGFVAGRRGPQSRRAQEVASSGASTS